MTFLPVLLAASLLLPLGANEPASPTELTACMRRNMPEPDSVRALRIVARDRVGSERITVVRLYGRRTEEGGRQVLLRVVSPEDLKGDALLILETSTAIEMYFKSTDFPKAKRIRAEGRSIPLFGSDLTYEDFAHLLALNRPGRSKRLEDDRIGDRPVFVVETRSKTSAGSSYDSIVTFVDKERCVALRVEFFDRNDTLRKILSVNPTQIMKRGDIWLAHMSTMRDLRDRTTTQVFVDSTDHDVQLTDETFSIETLAASQEH